MGDARIVQKIEGAAAGCTESGLDDASDARGRASKAGQSGNISVVSRRAVSLVDASSGRRVEEVDLARQAECLILAIQAWEDTGSAQSSISVESIWALGQALVIIEIISALAYRAVRGVVDAGHAANITV